MDRTCLQETLTASCVRMGMKDKFSRTYAIAAVSGPLDVKGLERVCPFAFKTGCRKNVPHLGQETFSAH
jgi:hypothetical protein